MIITDSAESSEGEELKNDPDDVEVPEETKANELYPIEKRKPIVDYWWNNESKRSYSSVQSK